MTNYIEITDLNRIKEIIKEGYTITIVSDDNELETKNLEIIKRFIFNDDCKFYQILKTDNENKDNDDILKHLSHVMNSYHMGLTIKRYNEFEDTSFNKNNEKIPVWDFVNFKYDVV